MTTRRDPTRPPGELGAELGWPTKLVYGSLQLLARTLAAMYWRAWVHDKHKMPATGAVIVSPVHRSNLDVPLLGALAPRRMRYMAKGSLFKSRFWTWFLTMLGGFPLRREAALDREALQASQQILARGEPLAVFPEGERKAGPRVYPMLDGAVWLSTKTGAPILPVGIGGSAHSMPKGRLIPWPTKIVYLYGDLVYPPTPDAGRSRLTRAQITAHSALLREQIQDLFDEAQRRAGQSVPANTHELPVTEESTGT